MARDRSSRAGPGNPIVFRPSTDRTSTRCHTHADGQQDRCIPRSSLCSHTTAADLHFQAYWFSLDTSPVIPSASLSHVPCLAVNLLDLDVCVRQMPGAIDHPGQLRDIELLNRVPPVALIKHRDRHPRCLGQAGAQLLAFGLQCFVVAEADKWAGAMRADFETDHLWLIGCHCSARS